MVKYNENKCVKLFFLFLYISLSLSIFFDDLIPNFRRSTVASGNVAIAAPGKYNFQGSTLLATKYRSHYFAGRHRDAHMDHVKSEIEDYR